MTADPLGFGLDVWRNAFLKADLAGRMDPTTDTRLIDRALDVSHMSLPFRLYGAIIGGKLSGRPALAQRAERLLQSDAVRGVELGSRFGRSPHSGINKVMFATALAPLSLQPLDKECNMTTSC
eukprot:Hpha_TRINITY_DN13420_c0_g1::TRINITY_DN13420_c0_g1_i1::g.131017::m.131017